MAKKILIRIKELRAAKTLLDLDTERQRPKHSEIVLQKTLEKWTLVAPSLLSAKFSSHLTIFNERRNSNGRLTCRLDRYRRLLQRHYPHDRRFEYRCGVRDAILIGAVLAAVILLIFLRNLKITLIAAGKNRMRPIVMTALTAIFALLPLAVGMGRGSAMQQPLAIAIISGLILNPPLILFVLPVLLGFSYGGKQGGRKVEKSE